MKISNIIALTSIALIGYAMYAMQRPGVERGESSAMGAARGPEGKVARLEEIAAESIARQIHDQKKTSFMLGGDETPLSEFSEPMRDLVAEAYYRLYPDAWAPERVQEIPDTLSGLAALPDGGFVRVFSDWQTFRENLEYWRMKGDNQFHRSQIITRENTLIGSIAVSADGNLLAADMRSGVFVYERRADDEFTLLEKVPLDVEDTDKIRQLAIHHSESSKSLVAESIKPSGLRVLDIFGWDNKRNSFVRQQEITHNEESIKNINFDGTGNYFACASDTKVEIWSRNSSTGLWESKEILMLSGAPFGATCVAFSPDDRFILTTRLEGFTLWKMNQQSASTLVQNISLGGNQGPCNFSVDSSRFSSIELNRMSANIWNLNRANNQIKRIYSLGKLRYSSALFVGDEYLVIGSYEGMIEIWHVPKPTVQKIWDYILNHVDIAELEA